VDAEQAVWREIRGLDARLARLEVREVATMRDLDAAVMTMRHEARGEAAGVGTPLDVRVTELEGDMDNVKLWQAKQTMKLGIVVVVASILGTGLVQLAVRLLAQ